MKQIGIICKDNFLFQKIKLILADEASCVRLINGETEPGIHVCLADIDSTDSPLPVGAITMSRTVDCDLKIPFSDRQLLELIRDEKKYGDLRLCFDDKSVVFKNRKLKLTELEFNLLKMLVSEKRFFSKDEILLSLWDENTDAGVVNVYVHYLREKLEADGDNVTKERQALCVERLTGLC